MITNDKQQRNLKFIGEYTGELCWRCAFSQVAFKGWTGNNALSIISKYKILNVQNMHKIL